MDNSLIVLYFFFIENSVVYFKFDIHIFLYNKIKKKCKYIIWTWVGYYGIRTRTHTRSFYQKITYARICIYKAAFTLSVVGVFCGYSLGMGQLSSRV
jgi:hypothetical protein